MGNKDITDFNEAQLRKRGNIRCQINLKWWKKD